MDRGECKVSPSAETAGMPTSHQWLETAGEAVEGSFVFLAGFGDAAEKPGCCVMRRSRSSSGLRRDGFCQGF